MEEQTTNKVKDMKIRFNTEDGQATFKTPIINAELKSLIIESYDEISVYIQSELGYEIFHETQHIGTKYYAIGPIKRGPKSRLDVSDQITNFYLNESIEILISGGRNKEVTIILRTE